MNLVRNRLAKIQIVLGCKVNAIHTVRGDEISHVPALVSKLRSIVIAAVERDVKEGV